MEVIFEAPGIGFFSGDASRFPFRLGDGSQDEQQFNGRLKERLKQIITEKGCCRLFFSGAPYLEVFVYKALVEILEEDRTERKISWIELSFLTNDKYEEMWHNMIISRILNAAPHITLTFTSHPIHGEDVTKEVEKIEISDFSITYWVNEEDRIKLEDEMCGRTFELEMGYKFYNLASC